MTIEFRADTNAPAWDLFVKSIKISAILNPHLTQDDEAIWMVEGNALSPANFRLSSDEPSKGSAWPRKEG